MTEQIQGKEKQEEEIIQQEFQKLLHDYLNSTHRKKVEIIEKAFHFAYQAHKGARRRSGEPYIMHPLAVARILSKELGLGSTSICSALLHDVVEDTDYTVEDIQNLFGEKIALIVDGLTKISGGIFADRVSEQAENFRKLLLTMSEDIRVILIKIADRLHNMRTLSSMPAAKQYKIAGETQYIYAPLAHRLGLHAIKTELENLSFKYEHPETYKEIEKKRQDSHIERATVYKEFSQPIRKKLESMGYKFELTTRTKTVYSIWSKMQTKNVPFSEVFDIMALRIVFDKGDNVSPQEEKAACWHIYSAITDMYKPHPDRLRDWITTPKANGYEALHTTVMGPDGHWIEVQIRSKRMDEIAEKGFAAHWKYKEQNVEEDTELDKWLQTIMEILENPNPDSIDFLDTIKLNLFSSEIFVFTPKGEIITLPQGATALDFAYELHSDIGNHCIGAKMNHRLVPLSHKLSSGDQVEILTSRSQQPVAEWLKFVTTAKARTKVENALKRTRREMSKKGEVKLIETFKKSWIEPITSSDMDKVAYYFGFPRREDLFYAIEKGDVVLPDNLKKIITGPTDSILSKLWKQTQRIMQKKPNEESQIQYDEHKLTIDRNKPYILSDLTFNKNYEIASCCKPIPGDNVLGFINDDETVTVHKLSCRIAMRLKTSFGDRILSVTWNNNTGASFEATIEVKGIDSIGVLNSITKTISDYNVNILNLLIDVKDGVFDGRIKMQVHNVEDIQKMCVSLSKIKNIKSAMRIVD